eukprot:CAMPEP_0172306858 /NCGR_PEP_ID=MMETSP1058-20130122/7838_1 /TAXON_ID=83371 /ORGANISM="Detonula confervacea, Strain CCMP 353" /LENGTH=995 /DNA_ID=CAMNT_0013018873 /DNA_START=5 /DNA_END=2992 /DNA_ORIENTATION=-
MSSKPLPPPPKMSGLTTPAGANASMSSVFTTPAGSSHITSRYQTPGKSNNTSIPSSSQKHQQSSTRGQSSTSKTRAGGRAIIASSYETYAPRSSDQRARLARIAALTAGPCFDNLANEEKQSDENDQSMMVVTLAEAMCPPKSSANEPNSSANNSSSAVDQSIITQTLHRTTLKTHSLTTLIKHTASLRLALSASLNITNDVSARHADLLRHSGELSAAAERLQHEEQLLSKRAEEIGMPLEHYDAVDHIGQLVGVLFKDGGRVTVRGIAKLHVDNDVEEFIQVLERIDNAVEFFGGNGGGFEMFGRPGSNTSSANEGRGGRGRGRGGREKLAKEQPYAPHASGSAEYYRRACALQDAALELLRVSVADRISATSAQIQDALGLPKTPIKADKLEASLVYTRFHGISKRSNALIGIARKRLDALGQDHASVSMAAASYEDLLTLCRNTYCGARETLLMSTVRTHMDILRERHGLVGMTRLASVFLIRLCTVETALYLDFFGDLDKRRGAGRSRGKNAAGEEKEDEDLEKEPGSPMSPQYKRMASSSTHPAASALASQILSEDATYRDAEFQSMLSSLCSSLHRTLRRGLVSVLDLDVLCQVVSVLREERSAANASPTTLAAARAVSGVIQDAQERLIFCANNALHKEVVRFKPAVGDLNYPGKLLGEKPKVAIIIEDDSKKDSDDKEESEADKSTTETAVEEAKPDDAVAAQLRIYESWFPPMRSVLRILSKIFRVVEPRVFEDIALQSVQSCTKSLKDGSVSILRKSGMIHADLFLVKHLLILREQLSPFDIQLRSVERQLDFSEAGKAVTRFLANRNRRLFSMSTENALITLLREGVSVQESSVDSKRDLEDCLRSACNDFIEHTSSSLLGPIAGFVDQCKSTATGGSNDALANAPFMSGALVKGVFSNALQNLDRELENVSKQMNLYLENTATQGILLKPVVRKMTRSLEEAKRFIGEAKDEENGWDKEVRDEVLKSLEEFELKVKVATSKK